MASKAFRKDVAKKKKDEILTAIKELMEEEFKSLPPAEYAAIYGAEYTKREGDTDEIFARIAYNKNVEMLSKMKKKPLEDLYVAYLEVKREAFKGPTKDDDPEIPS